MNSTGEARLTAMREAVQAVERIGPDAPLQTLPGIGITYQAGGRKLPMPLPTTVTPTEIVRSTLKLYPDLEPALEAVYNERAGKAGPAAPAPSATPAAPAPIPAAPNGATPGPVPSAPAAASTANAPATSTTPAVAALAEIPKATGKAAAYHGHKKNELRISLAQNQVDEVQQLLIANKLPVGSRDGKPDGKNGDVTQGSLKMLAQEFGIDPRKINFAAAERSPETQQFLEKAQQRAASLAAPATKGPSAEELAAQERARAEAASREQTARETQARAEADRREAPALLGTAYDSRNLARMSEEQRGQLARQTLLAIDELANKNKAHDYENLHDKMKEAVREANDIVGDNRFQLPLDQNHPFTTDAMTALGIVAAHKGHLDRPVRNEKEAREVVEDLIDMLDIKGRSQADRIATIERSAGLPVDGKVDPAMLRAAQQFFAQQAQLAPIRGGAEVTGSDVAAASVRGERGAAERAPGA